MLSACSEAALVAHTTWQNIGAMIIAECVVQMLHAYGTAGDDYHCIWPASYSQAPPAVKAAH